MKLKEKFENFMKKPIYLILVMTVFYLVWSMRFFIENDELLQITFITYIPLAIIVMLILIFFEDTIYTIPFVFGFIFSIGYIGMNLDTLKELKYAIIAAVFAVIGLIIHLIRFPFKIKMTPVLLIFLLASISFYIPLLYTPFSFEALFIASLGLLYVIIFTFYRFTIKDTNLNNLMQIMIALLFLFTMQLLSLTVEVLLLSEGTIAQRFANLPKSSIPFNPGWSNVNDLTNLLVLISGALLYYILKYPNRLVNILYFGINVMLIYFSFARTSMITSTILLIVTLIVAIFSKNKKLRINGIISLITAITIFVLSKDMIIVAYNQLKISIDKGVNAVLTGRPTLWKNAIEMFKTRPLFGVGWATPISILAPGENRFTVYHSTFFHVLATGGIFGMIILVFHFYVVYKLICNIKEKKIKYSLLFTFTLTQLHGLVDNTQYMLFYTIITIIMFVFIEKETEFTLSDLFKFKRKDKQLPLSDE